MKAESNRWGGSSDPEFSARMTRGFNFLISLTHVSRITTPNGNPE
jgi:hypothetical protein